MSFSPYLWLFIALGLISFIIGLILFYRRKNNTTLYSEGVRNENAGRYALALHNYEEALLEARKLKVNERFGKRITQKIKILRSTIDYEKNFHNGEF
jgi:hypothetical protein